jgi:hypothetical protein
VAVKRDGLTHRHRQALATKDHIAWRTAATLDIDRHHDDALAGPDPARGLRLAAGLQRRQYGEAARTDEDIAAGVRLIQANRERAFRRHLRAGVADGVDTYRTPGRYEEWLAGSLTTQLLS